METEPIERSAREARPRLTDVIADAVHGRTTYITSYGRREAAVVPLALAEAAGLTGAERGISDVRAHLADVIGDAIAGRVTHITIKGHRKAAVVPLAVADRLQKEASDGE